MWLRSPLHLSKNGVRAPQMRRSGAAMASKDKKIVWISTRKKEVLTTGMELGFGTLLVDADSAELAEEWSRLARFEVVVADKDGELLDASSRPIGRVCRLTNATDLAVEAEAVAPGFVVMNNCVTHDWQIIPAENLVAAFQGGAATLLAVARDAAGGRVMLEALEVGTDGVVLQTDDPAEVRALAQYLQGQARQGQALVGYETARVTAVRPVGMGHRACVDLAEAMVPGEGLLVGSFARALFLVHSECVESSYISSRPFRVNAGPVHAYVQAPNGRTRYLSELRSGEEVVVVDASGRQRAALVGRVKIEARPLVLVEAVTPDGEMHSHLLQNAETVKLVGPQAAPAESASATGGTPSWRAISVSELQLGDEVFVLRQGGARHTGISIEESIIER